MTREQMIAIARRMDTADGTEQELDSLLTQLDEALPHADVVTLLFQARPELTAEAAIDEALRREAAWRATHD